MKYGLKSVTNRRDDTLSRVGWERLEALLAEHYQRQGYQVEHVGTGGSGRRFDGGIDLKLRKDDAYILVQSKHWNAYQVTHNAVHELLGVMVNEGATGAILVTSGEFTRAAIEAANRQGHVQLVDGDALRVMLGPIAELPPSPAQARNADATTPHVVRSGRQKTPTARARVGTEQRAWLLVALLGCIGFVVLIMLLLQRTAGTAGPSPPDVAAPLPAPQGESPRLMQQVDVPTRVEDAAYVSMPQARPSTPAEIRESQRKADEAIRVIEKTTPQM